MARKTPTSERLYELIGQRVSEERKKLDWTQSQLAAQSGLSRTAIANIEVGRQRVTLHSLFAIGEALGVDYRTLIPTLSNYKATYRPTGKLTSRHERVIGDNWQVRDFIREHMEK